MFCMSSKKSKEDDYHFFVVYCSDVFPPLDDTHMSIYGDDICEILSFNSSEIESDFVNRITSEYDHIVS